MTDIPEFYRWLGVENEDTVQALAENSKVLHLKKGQSLIREGDTLKYVFFHLTEHAATYGVRLLENGTEIVLGFGHGYGHACMGANGIEADIINSVVCLQDQDFLRLDIEALVTILMSDPEAARVYNRLMVQDHDWDVRTMTALQTRDAESRYLWFLETYADVADLIPVSLVASFLGIRLQSLSRIRRKLKDEGRLPE